MPRISVNTNASAVDMAEEILGSGFTVNSAFYYGDNRSSGIYSGADSTAPGVMPSDEGVLFSTGRARQFSNRNGGYNQETDRSNDTSGVNNDADFNAAAGTSTYDASFIEINFTPDAGQTSLNIEFRFYSEEYNEYVYSNFNDLALVMLDGVEVPLSVGDGSISVNSINDAANNNPANGSESNDPNPGNGQFDSSSPNLYVDNTGGAYNTEMDGFTVTLSLDITLTPGQTYDLKIGIADVGDSLYDSAIAIASNTQTGMVDNDPIAVDDSVSVNQGNTVNAAILSNDSDPNNQTLTITQINGVNVVAGDSVTLATGQVVTLNANGTITVDTSGSAAGTDYFSYTIEDTDGNTDSAFVTLTTNVPCFVDGTEISTPTGPRKVEDLRKGDLVITLDHGLQPIRWIGARHLSGAALFAASGSYHPIRLGRGADLGFGPLETDLRVSPMHRMLVRSSRLNLATGASEGLIPARFLAALDGVEADTHIRGVSYYHLLFDTHEVIFANGVPSESLHPGHMALEGFTRETRDSLFDVMPLLRIDPKLYGPAARYVVREHEASLITGPDLRLVTNVKPVLPRGGTNATRRVR